MARHGDRCWHNPSHDRTAAPAGQDLRRRAPRPGRLRGGPQAHRGRPRGADPDPCRTRPARRGGHRRVPARHAGRTRWCWPPPGSGGSWPTRPTRCSSWRTTSRSSSASWPARTRRASPGCSSSARSCIYPRLAPQPIREEALLTGPLEPTNEAYALAKIAGIVQVQSYRRQYGARYISAMPTNLYGPGDNFDLATSHVLPALIRRFHEAERERPAGADAVGQRHPAPRVPARRRPRGRLRAAAARLRRRRAGERRLRRGPDDPRTRRDRTGRGRLPRRHRLGHLQARRHAAQAARRLPAARARLAAADRTARRHRRGLRALAGAGAGAPARTAGSAADAAHQ